MTAGPFRDMTDEGGENVMPSLRTFLFAALLLAGGTAVFAQTYPLPSNTPETPVLCGAGCSDPNLKTVGYKAPISTFTGRFLDSTATSEWFMPFRTARANFVLVMPGIDRIYFRYGNGSVAAYKLSTFFSRLEAKEQLVFPVRPIPANRSNQPELFLNWDAWFNPELSTWKTFNIDGATRMTGFDVDDKGYVYVASTIFGWGVVKDDLGSGGGGKMASMFQKFPGEGDPKPGKIAAIRGATRYYAYLSASTRNLWDVTDHANPVQLPAIAPLFSAFAKNSTADRVAIVDASNSRLSIYTGDALAGGGGPLFTDPGSSQFVTSDGTNFYALQNTSAGKVISVIVPAGLNGYTVQGSYSIGSPMNATAIHYGDGYIVLPGESGSWDLRLFKLGANLVPTQVAINASPAPADGTGFFRNYYGSAPTGYTTPAYINMYDGTVYKGANGKLYLVVCAAGLGDVYELAGGDTITTTNNGRAGTNNANTPAASNTKTFYGDPVQFTARSSSPNVASVVWNFGNPEAGLATNTQQPSGINQPIVYQYSNIARTALGTRNVVASNISDPTIKGGTTVTLESPAARFAIAGLATKYLFTQPNASSAAPVVVGDSFVDASDGTIESHYASWMLDGALTKASPAVPLSVGTCGSHTLNFSAFYGPYDGTPATKGTNFEVPVGAVTYAVRPFAAALELAGTDATNLTFRSVSRIGDPALVTAAQGLTYTWDVLTSTNAVILSSGPLSTVTNFPVPKQTLVGQQNLRVRLTLKTVGALVGACAGYESSAALSIPLNAPDPKVTLTSGDCQGTPCTFSASSISGIDTTADNWIYKWAVTGTQTGIIPVSTVLTNQTLTTTFLKQGTFSISVTATNAIGTTISAVYPVTINVVANPCGTLNASSFVPTWYGKSSGCSPFSACTSGETITFMANAPQQGGYDPNCGIHTYTWTFPDGTTATTNDPSIDRIVSSGGSVKVNVNNGTASRDYVIPQPLSFGTVTPPPPPPNTNPCGAMSSTNMFLSISGASCPSGGTCTTGDLLSFQAQPYLYNLGCAQHTFSWSFGDGGSSNQQNPVHAYTSNGPHTVTMTVSNPYQTYSKTASVTTTAGSGTGGGSCPTMTTSNIAISFSALSGCTPGGTPCKNGETITFDVVSYANYDFSCSTHNYNWNFGDGGTASGKTPTHTFTTSGPHAVSVTISNTSQQNFVRNFTVQTTDGSGSGSGSCGPITPNVTLSVTFANAAGTCNQLGGDCATGEVVTFNVISYLYDLGCATHTFDWDFGDGSPHLSGQSVTHQYAAQGNYSVKCLVSNGGPTVPLTAAISIKGGSNARPTVIVSYGVAPLPSVANGFLFTPAFDHPELVAKWTWDFGDKSGLVTRPKTGSTLTPETHVYPDSKAYVVTLTAYDASGTPIGVATQPGEVKRRSVRH